MRIGVFDSGVGGLTVLKSIYEKYNDNEYIYIGDNKNLPYGNKTKEELFSYASRIIDYFISKDIKLIVIGCNTICSNIFNDLKEKYKDITFIGVIDATIDLFLKSNKRNVLVIATENTIKSNKYEEKIKKNNSNIIVHNLSTPALVPLIEENKDCSDEINSILRNFKDIDSIILGCTHYKLIEHLIPKNIACIDSSSGVINVIDDYIVDSVDAARSIKIYTTGNLNEFNVVCTRIMNIAAEKLDL